MAIQWQPEDDEQQLELPPEGAAMTLLTNRQLNTVGRVAVAPTYQTKAYLVLVDSDKHDWGIIEDTLDNLLWEPGKGEIVGTWTRPRYDNLIHVSLATSISALQDRSIQTFAKYAEERRNAGAVKKAPSKRAARAAAAAYKQPQEQAELSVTQKLEFNSLRAKLGRVK